MDTAKSARERGISIRELYLTISGARGHWQVVGTPERIADQLQSWFENDAADGFNVMPPGIGGARGSSGSGPTTAAASVT